MLTQRLTLEYKMHRNEIQKISKIYPIISLIKNKYFSLYTSNKRLYSCFKEFWQHRQSKSPIQSPQGHCPHRGDCSNGFTMHLSVLKRGLWCCFYLVRKVKHCYYKRKNKRRKSTTHLITETLNRISCQSFIYAQIYNHTYFI